MTEIDLSQDELILTELEVYADEWEEFVELTDQLKREEMAWQSRWLQENKERIERQKYLQAQVDELREKLNVYVSKQTANTGRRKYLGGLVSVNVLPRAGEYLPEDLEAWVKDNEYWQLMSLPDKKKEQTTYDLLTQWLRTTKSDYLVVDMKQAEKTAIDKDEHWNKVFPESPVPLVGKVTQVSEEKLNKVMSTLQAMGVFSDTTNQTTSDDPIESDSV